MHSETVTIRLSVVLLSFLAVDALFGGEALAPSPEPGPPAPSQKWFDRFTLGGYGEVHGNFTEGGSSDVVDIHRFVL
ncbi:MAG: hypothetical protein ACYTFG_03225 [Planctomycetota bacterium]|jgi:hypothetical protein